MIPAPFDYLRAGSLDEALDALAEPGAMPLAGGQSLIPLLKFRLARPSLIVDISRLPLKRIKTDRQGVRLGPLCTWRELASADALRTPQLAAIADCARRIGDLQVRNLGTIGGGLAHADPAADMPAVAVALGARVRVRSPSGQRELPATEFFVGPFTTALEPQELVDEVIVPQPPRRSGSAYVAVKHPASGFALAGAAVLVSSKDGRAHACSIGLTGIGGKPVFLHVEGLDGQTGLADEAVAAVAELEPIGDPQTPAEYRRQLAAVVTRRALERAIARAREGSQ